MDTDIAKEIPIKEKKNEIIALSKNDRRSAFKPEKVSREQESLAVWTAGGSKLDV